MSSSIPNHAFLLSQSSAGVPGMTSFSSTSSATRTTYLEINPGSPLTPFDQPPPYESQQSYLTRLQFVNLSFPHLRPFDYSSQVNNSTRSTSAILVLGVASTISDVAKAAALKQVEQSDVDLRGSLGSFSKWMGSFVAKATYISGGIITATIAATFISSHFTESWTDFLLKLAEIIFK